MHFFEYYNENVIKYDLINKFLYRNLNSLPQLEAVVLNFGCKSSELKLLLPSLLALELISGKKGSFVSSNKANISLKIKKGNLVGCKVVLRKRLMYIFLFKLLNEIFPQLRNFTGFRIKPKPSIKSVSYKLQNSLLFTGLELNYYLFNTLPALDITFLTNSVSSNEFLFLLNSFKLPLTMVKN